MTHRLITDAGSTKTEWVLLDETGAETERIKTPGINALLADETYMQDIFSGIKEQLGSNRILKEIYYYGAGCATPEICKKTEALLKSNFGCESVSVSSDLLGAARGLLGSNAGIACILGTGSNSCLYDGNSIVKNIPSLGFILGDEGSGAALGKRLVADLFKGRLPDIICDKFLDTYHITISDILDKVYKQPAPNKYLASLVPFIKENLWNPYIYSMVQKEFSRFFKRNVSSYPGSRRLPICFTGGIANAFADILRDTAKRLGYNPGEISVNPMEGLIKYHGSASN